MLIVKKTSPQAAKKLKDVQSEQDRRNIPLKHAGIKNLRWPVTLKDKERGEQHTVAQVSMSVDLPHDLRGTHMSRFVEVLQQLGTLSLDSLEGVLDSLKEHLQAEKAFLELRFPYFITKQAPVAPQRPAQRRRRQLRRARFRQP